METGSRRRFARRLPVVSAAVVVLLAASTGSAVAEPPERVGLAYEGGAGDLFGDLALAGTALAEDELKVQVRELAEVQGKSERVRDPEAVIDRLARPNTDLVIGVGFHFTDALAAAAAAEPDTNFALIDSTYPDYTRNLAGLITATNEGSFLVGAAAALTSSGSVGFLGATDVPVIEDFRLGYVAGLDAAIPGVTVDTRYIAEPGDYGGFTNPEGAYQIATEMYAGGVDVIFPPAGRSTIGVAFAARDYTASTGDMVWMIGPDTDFYTYLPEVTNEAASLQPHVLTSMVKNIDVLVYNTIRDQTQSRFTSGDVLFDLAANGVDYATSGGFIDSLVPTLEHYRDAIINGAITVPTAR